MRVKYPFSLRILHWVIAGLVLGLGLLGFFMTSDNLSEQTHNRLYYIHKSFGFLTLVLMVIRLTIRTRTSVPSLPAGLSRVERWSARVSHKLLYVLAIAVPVFGYVQVNAFAGSHGAPFFFFELPQLVPDNEAIFSIAHPAHRYAAYALLLLVVLHAAGALKHHFFDKEENDVLKRMT